MPNLDTSCLVRVGFEDKVANAFSAEESVDMSTKSGLLIEFKGSLDFICNDSKFITLFRHEIGPLLNQVHKPFTLNFFTFCILSLPVESHKSYS